MNNGEQSAYPIHGGYQNDDPRNQIIGGGLTKREYFAAMALSSGKYATEAMELADQLLKLLEDNK